MFVGLCGIICYIVLKFRCFVMSGCFYCMGVIFNDVDFVGCVDFYKCVYVIEMVLYVVEY